MGEPAAMSSIIAHPLLSCLGFFVALWICLEAGRFRDAFARSNAIRAEIWALANVAGHRPDALPATNMLLLPAINAMIDIEYPRFGFISVEPFEQETFALALPK